MLIGCSPPLCDSVGRIVGGQPKGSLPDPGSGVSSCQRNHEECGPFWNNCCCFFEVPPELPAEHSASQDKNGSLLD